MPPPTPPPETPMRHALAEAEKSAHRDEVPVGAVITDRHGQVLAACGNQMRQLCDPTAHAEMLALRMAATKIGHEKLADCDLYVTLEPCAMCAGAIALARIRRLYYGAADEKTGAVDNGVHYFNHASCQHRPEIYGGIEEAACAKLLRDFFQTKRSEQMTRIKRTE